MISTKSGATIRDSPVADRPAREAKAMEETTAPQHIAKIKGDMNARLS